MFFWFFLEMYSRAWPSNQLVIISDQNISVIDFFLHLKNVNQNIACVVITN